MTSEPRLFRSYYVLVISLAYVLLFCYQFILVREWASTCLIFCAFLISFFLGVWWAHLRITEANQRELELSKNWINRR